MLRSIPCKLEVSHEDLRLSAVSSIDTGVAACLQRSFKEYARNADGPNPIRMTLLVSLYLCIF